MSGEHRRTFRRLAVAADVKAALVEVSSPIMPSVGDCMRFIFSSFFDYDVYWNKKSCAGLDEHGFEGVIAHEFGHIKFSNLSNRSMTRVKMRATRAEIDEAAGICRAVMESENLHGFELAARLLEIKSEKKNVARLLGHYAEEFFADAFAINLTGHGGVLSALKHFTGQVDHAGRFHPPSGLRHISGQAVLQQLKAA